MTNWEIFKKLEEIESAIFKIQRQGKDEIREELKIAVMNILECQNKMYKLYENENK